MTVRSGLFAIAVAATFALPAGAQTAPEGVVLASDPESVLDFFFNEGIPAKLTTDAIGDPLIEFRNGSDSLQLYFYDCEDNVECLALQFFSGYIVDGGVSLETINQWNTDRRFVRAYLTDEGAARIEMDVATSWDGITYRDFRDLYDLWMESVALFEDRINW